MLPSILSRTGQPKDEMPQAQRLRNAALKGWGIQQCDGVWDRLSRETSGDGSMGVGRT